MEKYLASERSAGATFERTLKLSLDAWTVGHLALGDGGVKEIPSREKILAERKERLRGAGVESRGPGNVMTSGRSVIVPLSESEIRSGLGD